MNEGWEIEVRKVGGSWEYRVVDKVSREPITYNELSYDNIPILAYKLKISSMHYPISILRPTADGYAVTRKGAIRKAKYHIKHVNEILTKGKTSSPEWEKV